MSNRDTVQRLRAPALTLVAVILAALWLQKIASPALLVWTLPGVVTATLGWLMFKLQSGADDWPERRDIGLTCGVLCFGLAGGFYALYASTAYVAFSHRTAGILAVEMWSLATYAFGFGVGFLFGIPRVLQGDNPSGVAGGTYIQKVNTNLEQISDWLTKIIVGLGLVQLQQLPGFLKRVSVWAAASLPLAQGSSVAQVAAFATAFIVYFSITGFLAGYLLTRLYLAGAFRRADQPSTTISKPSPSLSSPTIANGGAPADPADKLRSFWLAGPNGGPDPVHEKQLLDWLEAHALSDVPLAKFLAAADYVDQRQQAAAQFKL